MFKATHHFWKQTANLPNNQRKRVMQVQGRKKNKILYLIIGLMAVALVGICAVQLYWIRQAITIHQEQFNSQVKDAMMAVSNRLQMIETTSIIVEASAKAEAIEKGAVPLTPPAEIEPPKEEIPAHPAISDGKHSGIVHFTAKGSVAEHSNFQAPICSNKFFVTSALSDNKTCSIMVKGYSSRKTSVDKCKKRAKELHSAFQQLIIQQAQGGPHPDLPERHTGSTSFSLLVNNRVPIDHFSYRGASLVSLPLRNLSDSTKLTPEEVKREKLMQKASLLEEIIKELTVVNRPINHRVNLCTLDSLLRVELKNYNINREFVYGIMTKDSMISSAYLSQHDAKASPYKVRLFPYDLSNQTYDLVLSFTDEEPSFWKNNTGVLGLASLFISLIIVCFGYTVVTIHNQKKLSQMKQDFINNMTHEFKTPITTISLVSEALSGVNENTKPEKIKKFAHIIAEENKRLEDQVVRVLQMAEIERKEIKLNLDELDVNETIEDALEKIAIQVESRGGKITTDFCPENPIITVDALHFINIVTNLLDNANKYSPETPEIAVKTTCNDQGVTISVSDKGLGMTQEQIRHIFQKFYRVHTGDRHDIKGFGLGLSYVKSLVEAHGGTIKVESKPNVGSRFDVFFPYQPQSMA
jgi:two-component system phosphate regulon sensor histidine kinase PhoR